MIRKLFIEMPKDNELYRTCSIEYAVILLKNKSIKVKNKKFTSFTLDWEKSNAALGFSGTSEIRIVFNYRELKKINKLVEVVYEPDFFEYFPDIAQHVLAYENKEEYIEFSSDSIPWDSYISDFEDEQEVVGPPLIKINDKCILRIDAPKKYKKKLEEFENIYIINYI